MSGFLTGKIPYISLCSGYEGIGLGLHRAIPNLRTVAYCEREAFAIGNLVKKVEAGLLDAAPVFTDVAAFPYREFRPIMGQGIISAGFPCQPVSCAGKRKATEDERWLFDILCDGFELMQPGYIFCENVDGLLSAKMPDGSLVIAHIVTRLEKMDYRVEVGVFSAAEVGAPHQRKRVFILAARAELAVSHGQRLQGERPLHSEAGREDEGRQAGLCDGAGASTLWPSRPGEPQHWWEPPRTVAHGHKQHDDRSGDRRAGRRDEFADESLGEAFGAVGRDSHGTSHRLDHAELFSSCDNRVDELRLLGNGVVPATAEKAWRTLFARIVANPDQ